MSVAYASWSPPNAVFHTYSGPVVVACSTFVLIAIVPWIATHGCVPSAGAPFDRMPLATLIEEAVAPHRDFGVAIKIRVAVSGTPEPVVTRNPAILYGLGNLVENAIDFARERNAACHQVPVLA